MAVPRRYHLVTLGCPKNDADSAHLARLLEGGELVPVADPGEADAIIVNTCGFIEQSQAQSMAAVRELAAAKREGQVLIVAGCMTQLYGRQVKEETPGIDHVFGVGQWHEVARLLQVDVDAIYDIPESNVRVEGPERVPEDFGRVRCAVHLLRDSEDQGRAAVSSGGAAGEGGAPAGGGGGEGAGAGWAGHDGVGRGPRDAGRERAAGAFADAERGRRAGDVAAADVRLPEPGDAGADRDDGGAAERGALPRCAAPARERGGAAADEAAAQPRAGVPVHRGAAAGDAGYRAADVVHCGVPGGDGGGVRGAAGLRAGGGVRPCGVLHLFAAAVDGGLRDGGTGAGRGEGGAAGAVHGAAAGDLGAARGAVHRTDAGAAGRRRRRGRGRAAGGGGAHPTAKRRRWTGWCSRGGVRGRASGCGWRSRMPRSTTSSGGWCASGRGAAGGGQSPRNTGGVHSAGRVPRAGRVC